jgi:hypothetical protein
LLFGPASEIIKFPTDGNLCRTFGSAGASNDNEGGGMQQSNGRSIYRQAGALFCGFLLLCPASSLLAQTPEQAAVALLSSDQLDDLVAPVALYPDSLLGQVFAASTYPLEIVEAQQWLLQNRALQVAQLVEAAKQQNWDPSVQALVAFPNVLTLLNRDIRWTTDLGNAFLAQQADVMNAVQRMRSRAQANGKLVTTPEQSVTIETRDDPPAIPIEPTSPQVITRDDQPAIKIQPTNPQVVYVPTYNPVYVWGPPVVGAYPALGYPNTGYGIGFDPGVLISALFTGLLSFTGWGWGLNWLAHGLFLNNLFFGHFGFGGYGRGFGERAVWVHNPGHRLGVPYPNRSIAGRFGTGRSVGAIGARSFAPARPAVSRNQGSAGRPYNRTAEAGRRAVDPNRYNSPVRSYQSASRAAPQRATQSFASSYRAASPASRAPAASFRSSSPKMPRSFSKPAKSSHMRTPHVSSHSGGHSSGGHSGKHR